MLKCTLTDGSVVYTPIHTVYSVTENDEGAKIMTFKLVNGEVAYRTVVGCTIMKPGDKF